MKGQCSFIEEKFKDSLKFMFRGSTATYQESAVQVGKESAPQMGTDPLLLVVKQSSRSQPSYV